MNKNFFSTFAAVALTLCLASCGNSPQGEHINPTEQSLAETAAITTSAEISETETSAEVTENVPNKDITKEQQILEPDSSKWYSSDVLRENPHLTTLVDYIINDLQNDSNNFFTPYGVVVIMLTDFNNDGDTDAFISTAHMGINYCMIDNIEEPKFLHSFSAFDNDNIDFLYDNEAERLVIKYTHYYGHFTNATSETNFIFAGDEITEISHVHFTGTSGPEEFYIVDGNGEKTVCGEADINASIAEIKKDLQPFNGDTERFRMTVEDDTLEIEKISD